MSFRNFVYALLYLGATNGTFDPQKKTIKLISKSTHEGSIRCLSKIVCLFRA